MINFFGFVITIVFYKLAEVLKRFPILSKLPPIIIAGGAVILMLEICHIDFETYNKSASYLTFLLMPATIALGYPIYKNIELLKQNKRIIYTAFFAATVFAIVTTYLTAKICHADLYIIESMLPKSVTAPIAVEISKNIGGIPELTACVVVLTGVFGGIFGHKILELLKVKNDIAIGLSMGAASHVVGTASCVEKGREKQIVMASVALVIVGVLTAIIAPLFLYLLKVN
ncbi:MAG: LrgB family protein [Candidatus Gastranaerophilales bacterium]|nr:LrgB family protein [Candidatus Gastranaerophilales bacterium]MCM1073065.1 LrgB family protein [Bacteroides sp.]